MVFQVATCGHFARNIVIKQRAFITIFKQGGGIGIRDWSARNFIISMVAKLVLYQAHRDLEEAWRGDDHSQEGGKQDER